MRATVLPLLLSLVLAACGGGGGDSSPAPVPTPPVDNLPGLTDTTVYSSAADASLPGAVEAAAVSTKTLTANGQTLSYTATAGHLIARDANGAAQASVFYVAYALPGADAATRPVTFFYNGGPGSASVWLQLGSFGPRRLVSNAPDTTAARPFPMVDNAEHFLGQSDLVFINAVGNGYSQAIAPFTNRSFWGVDSDAALFRDFIQRYLVVNNRAASPKYLFGESYGGPRTAVLARRLQDAGVMLDGLVLQSPAMDYNSNCGITNGQGCSGYLPSFAAVGAFHRLTQPVPTDAEAWIAQARAYADQVYAPAVQSWLTNGQPAPALWQPLADLTGLSAALWQANLNLSATAFRQQLVAGNLLGRYDGRMKAPNGSALAAEGDPSSTWIGSSFAQGIVTHLRDELGYRNASTYVVLSGAINFWDFSHAGRQLPDTLPDLAAALAQNPRLRVLAVSGYHDLATPFRLTETDLARVDASRVKIRNYPGGHMSYLDDATRVAQLADMKAFYANTLALRSAADLGPERRALEGRPIVMRDRAGTPQAPGSVIPTNEAAFQAPLRDPWVPPTIRAQ
jgi:carboxypeptidase C (cathepsin A)